MIYQMGRSLLVASCLGMAAGVAAAAPLKEVLIETNPGGATVYLNDKEDGPACKPTPCSVKVPVGETTVIIELPGHKPVVENITVGAKTKQPKFPFTLTAATGSIVLKGPSGVIVRMDDVEKGKVPASFDAPAGEHTFTWYQGNKQVYQRKVTVGDGEEIELAYTPSKAGGETKKAEKKKEPPAEPATSIGETSEPAAPARAARSTPFVSVGLAFDVGFRQFTYQDASEDADENEGGNMRAGPVIELYPTTLLGIGALPGLAVVARFEQGLNKQEVEFVEGGAVGAKTYWQSFEVSLRQRWQVGDSAKLDVGAGFVRDRYQFEGELGNLPDADYRAVRIGGAASLDFGGLNPYIRAEERIVLDGTSGKLPGRFTGGASTANGIHGALGVAFMIGPTDIRLEGAITRYAWQFKPDATRDMFTANSAVDLIEHVQLTAGYAY